MQSPTRFHIIHGLLTSEIMFNMYWTLFTILPSMQFLFRTFLFFFLMELCKFKHYNKGISCFNKVIGKLKDKKKYFNLLQNKI